MWEVGPAPDLTTYSEVLRACRAASRKDWAIYVLAESLQRGLRPQCDHFDSAIGACRKGQWASARWLLEQMQLEGVEPTSTSYCFVMNACFRSAEADMALEVFDGVRDAGIEPHCYTIEGAIYACDVGRRWARALRLLQETRQARLHTTVRAQSAVVSACLKSRRWEEAHFLVSRARREKTPLILGAALNSMVLAYQRAEHWDEALSLLAEIQQHPGIPRGDPRLQPTWMY
mmetsp:Transcript_61818/g.123897  ORF Transcript_61818/g.123897 Transcript_61818/m.123897 type:complete len:231 (+) Transcript_61818:109-801(+)